MHLILTGATGLVGSACLQNMLSNKGVSKVSILSRRPVPMAEGHDKVQVILTKEYNNYSPEIMEKLKGAQGCVWAQGVSQNDVSSKVYEEITLNYPLAAANAFSSLYDPFRFILVSGEGATTTPGLFTAKYGVVKGRAEMALLELSKTSPTLRAYSLRPALVDPALHPEIHSFVPKLPVWKSAISSVLYPVTRAAFKNFSSPTQDLARVLVELAMSDGKPLEGEGISGEGRTISNVGSRKLAGI